jgi:hypothetical protein
MTEQYAVPVTLLALITEMTGSNIGRIMTEFSQSLQADAGKVVSTLY